MGQREAQSSPRLFWAIVGVAVVVVAVTLWSNREEDAGTSGRPLPADRLGESEHATPSPAAELAATSQQPRVRAPAVQMPDRGRLSVSREALRDGASLALGLQMPDDVRGQGPRPVKLVDVTGRVLELAGEPVDGAGTGVRLEIPPEWLEPGRYMIQVKTAESKPLAVRRYVLEVTTEEDAASEQ
jgi:hypothetical protein